MFYELQNHFQNPSESYNWSAYFEPFNDNVWFVILAVSAIAISVLAILSLFKHIEPEDNAAEFSLKKAFVFVPTALVFSRRWSVVPTRRRWVGNGQGSLIDGGGVLT